MCPSMRTVCTQEELDGIAGPVLCKFTAEWCPPCKAMQPALEQLEREFAHACQFVLVDVDAAEALVAAHQVRQIPFVKILDNGEERMAAVNPPEDVMREHLQSLNMRV